LLAILGLAISLPKGAKGEMPNIHRELKALLYTPVAPVLGSMTGASAGFITLALVLTDIEFTIGNSVGGKLAEWSLDEICPRIAPVFDYKVACTVANDQPRRGLPGRV
jgi:DHA1 family inner membrane transport protein